MNIYKPDRCQYDYRNLQIFPVLFKATLCTICNKSEKILTLKINPYAYIDKKAVNGNGTQMTNIS